MKGFRQKKAPTKQQLDSEQERIIQKVQELAMANRFLSQQLMRLSGDNAHLGREVAALTELVGSNPSDQPIQKGDVAIINFVGTVDGIPFQGGMSKKTAVRVGSGNFIPGFEEQLEGHVKGDSMLELNVTFPKDYGAKELAEKEAVFHVQIVEVFRDYVDSTPFDQKVEELNALKEEKEADEKAKQEAESSEEDSSSEEAQAE